MAVIATVTRPQAAPIGGVMQRTITRVEFAWEIDAAGTVTGTTAQYFTGQILRCVTIPSATNVPTVNYDVELLDDDGADIMNATVYNRSQTATENLLPVTPPAMANTRITCHVWHSGIGSQGTVILYIA